MINPDPRLTLNLLKELVKIPSVNPSIEPGEGEVAIAHYIERWFRKNGRFRVVEQSVEGDRFNVVAVLPGKSSRRSVMINGHMDTVGTSYMTTNAYRPTLKAGRLYGRGSCDMKGALAAMMSASAAAARGPTLEGDLIFAGVVDEEHGGKGTMKLATKYRATTAVVGEPTNLQIAIAHKGYAWLEVEVAGKEAHGSVPERGIDAIENAAKLITKLETLRKRYSLKRHRYVGTPKIHTSTISGGTDWSTIPGTCTLRLERRLIPGEEAIDARRELEKLIREIAARNPHFKAAVKLVHSANSMEIDANSPIVRVLRKNTKLVCGEAKVVGVPYWTDAATLVNRAKTPTCLFGPGNIEVAHSKNEHVKVEDVLKASKVYMKTAIEYCSVVNEA